MRTLVRRRNLDFTGAKPYVFYVDKRVRLFRATLAPWTDAQIVHEAFPPATYPLLGQVVVDHRFLQTDAARARKQRLYALLWAIQHARTKRRASVPRLAWLAHLLRDGVFRGSVLRGGLHALRAAGRVAEYSRLKHEYLLQIRGGEHAEALRAYESGELEKLFSVALA